MPLADDDSTEIVKKSNASNYLLRVAGNARLQVLLGQRGRHRLQRLRVMTACVLQAVKRKVRDYSHERNAESAPVRRKGFNIDRRSILWPIINGNKILRRYAFLASYLLREGCRNCTAT